MRGVGWGCAREVERGGHTYLRLARGVLKRHVGLRKQTFKKTDLRASFKNT